MVLSQKTPWPAAPLPAVSPPSFGFPVGHKPVIRQASPHLTTRARDKSFYLRPPFFGKPIIPPLPPEGGSENDSEENDTLTRMGASRPT